MTTTLQSYLKCLDRLNVRMLSVCREMLEIRTRVTECLDSIQSETTVMDSVTRDNSAYPPATFDDEHQNITTVALNEPNAILPLSTTLDLSDLLRPLAHGRLSDYELGAQQQCMTRPRF